MLAMPTSTRNVTFGRSSTCGDGMHVEVSIRSNREGGGLPRCAGSAGAGGCHEPGGGVVAHRLRVRFQSFRSGRTQMSLIGCWAGACAGSARTGRRGMATRWNWRRRSSIRRGSGARATRRRTGRGWGARRASRATTERTRTHTSSRRRCMCGRCGATRGAGWRRRPTVRSGRAGRPRCATRGPPLEPVA